MLAFEGETGPYVQYTHARACTLLHKGDWDSGAFAVDLTDEEAWPVVKALAEFPNIVQRAWNDADPSQVARHALALAKAFNAYYGKVRILGDSEHVKARMTLTWAVATVLKEGLRLLGIQAPERM
nr:DALR anticodon-binding domain-containing protein [Litoribacterium kuwaitense]